ncbi:hypothetical protein J8J14_22390 [Roseomonas sp. SSH11]|uniref:Uncharacterized protein n=1 Tax=Pararoseomonas baculiformis TaxID=2820812 RepID=A0ABS4AKW4_9PROT|nr:hypothetical protein [Pararoseomonas baculiformis]MBP0447514.1 hypothetical protein [Pararoseomonas baculiformis]
MLVGNAALWVFLLPGNAVSDLLQVDEEESRVMIRTLINMLVWNLIATLVVYSCLM